MARDHGQQTDPARRCESPIRGGWRRCENAALVNEPWCARHAVEAAHPTAAPETGYEWYPLRDGQGRPYFWFQLRSENAKRRARYLNRLGDNLSEAERSEVRRALGEDTLKSSRQK
jgi:hypothetical protein